MQTSIRVFPVLARRRTRTICALCREAVTLGDGIYVNIRLETTSAFQLHEACFRDMLVGLEMFRLKVLDGPPPGQTH
jgi:hypothetical protein